MPNPRGVGQVLGAGVRDIIRLVNLTRIDVAEHDSLVHEDHRSIALRMVQIDFFTAAKSLATKMVDAESI